MLYRIKRHWNRLLIWLKIRKEPAFNPQTLKDVQTYQAASLAFLQNLCCHIATANTKFKSYENHEGKDIDGIVNFKEKDIK